MNSPAQFGLGFGSQSGSRLGNKSSGLGDIFDVFSDITDVFGAGAKIYQSAASLFDSGSPGNAGFESYMAARPQLAYPPMATLLQAARQSRWAGDVIGAIQQTYSQASGTGSIGDWRFAVSSVTPIRVTFFKGPTERFTLEGGISYSPQALTQNQTQQTESSDIWVKVALGAGLVLVTGGLIMSAVEPADKLAGPGAGRSWKIRKESKEKALKVRALVF